MAIIAMNWLAAIAFYPIQSLCENACSHCDSIKCKDHSIAVSKNELWVLKAAKKGLKPTPRGPASVDEGHLVPIPAPRTRGVSRWPAPDYSRSCHGRDRFRPVDIQSAAADLPLEQTVIPLMCISLNDFPGAVAAHLYLSSGGEPRPGFRRSTEAASSLSRVPGESKRCGNRPNPAGQPRSGT
jgi:hypothetical protein